jgi:hypothetical protein
MNSNRSILESKDGKSTSTFRIENGILFATWKSFGNSGTSTHRLSTLNPDFAYHEAFQGNPSGPFQIGLFGILIVCFTALSDMEPMDKPGIYILGFSVTTIGFLISLVRMRKTKNTIIFKLDEMPGIAIDHNKFEENEVVEFKSFLREEILKSTPQQTAPPNPSGSGPLN